MMLAFDDSAKSVLGIINHSKAPLRLMTFTNVKVIVNARNFGHIRSPHACLHPGAGRCGHRACCGHAEL
jgi:hypothetical protein